MTFPTCPTVCSADLKSDLMSSFTLIDETNVTDRTCNGVLFLTDDAGLNDVTVPASGAWLATAGPRTKVIATFDEIAAHYAVGSETFEAAKLFFSNVGSRGVASYFLLGFWDEGAESAPTALDAINECQPCWTHVAVVHFNAAGDPLLDTAAMDELADWAVSNDKIPYLLSIDEDTKNPSNTTNLKARLFAAGIGDVYVHYTEGQCETVIDPVTGAIQYFAVGAPVVDAAGDPVIDPVTGLQAISDGTTPMSEIVYPYIEFLAAGWAANADLSQSNSGYTLAYKPVGGAGFVGVVPSALTNGDVAAITGVNPDGTINPANNGHANAYVRTGGHNGLFSGISVGGSWIDQIHLQKFLKRRIRDEIATLMFNSRRLPYDDARGQARLASAVQSVLTAAQTAGHFTGDAVDWESSGAYIRKGIGWVLRQDSFASQTAARKNARLAPQLRVCFIPAGATHHVPVQLCTLAVPSAA